MAGMNKVIIIGRLGNDPELKKVKDNAVARISVATSEKYKDKETTTWHTIIVWGKLAELCGKYLKKGSQACFEGKLQTRSWEKDGEKRYATEIIANNVMFLDSKSKGDEHHSQEPDPWSTI